MDFKKAYQYTKDLTVLYVEDDDNIRIETLEAFENFFDTVESAVNGSQGLEKYKQHFIEYDSYYDLVITDISMPIMDGHALIKEISQINSDQVIIVVSAYNESSRLVELIQSGISNFVLKPIVPTQLLEVFYKTCKSIVAQKEVDNYYQTLDEKVQMQSRELLATQQISIEAIATLIESYDDDTGLHINRIEAYSKLLVDDLAKHSTHKERLNICYECRNFIPTAALLHDIGKIIIPKEILQKPASLTDEEFETVKSHARYGGEILKKANETFKKQFNKDSYLAIASDIAMYHHEKFDGSGYPEGLKADEIPLSARIVALCDVYDALRSKRPYKEAWTHQKCENYIREQREIQFDPIVVDSFLKLSKDFDTAFNTFDKSGVHN